MTFQCQTSRRVHSVHASRQESLPEKIKISITNRCRDFLEGPALLEECHRGEGIDETKRNASLKTNTGLPLPDGMKCIRFQLQQRRAVVRSEESLCSKVCRETRGGIGVGVYRLSSRLELRQGLAAGWRSQGWKGRAEVEGAGRWPDVLTAGRGRAGSREVDCTGDMRLPKWN